MEILKPTIQTRYGMVINDGRPNIRPFPKTISQISKENNQKLTKYSHLIKDNVKVKQSLLCNLEACTSIQVNKETLLAYIEREQRIDVEQAVALALSIIPKEIASKA